MSTLQKISYYSRLFAVFFKQAMPFVQFCFVETTKESNDNVQTVKLAKKMGEFVLGMNNN